MKRIIASIILIQSTLAGFSQQGKVEPFGQPILKVSGVRINTVESDFGATLVGDTLFFASIKSRYSKEGTKNRKKHKFYGIFKAGTDPDGDLTGWRENVEGFSTPYHDGTVSSWCAKTGELFLTQTNRPQVRYSLFPKEYNNLKVSIAKKAGPKWEVVGGFPFNSPGYSVAHPAINETGDTLVFASDMPGGEGQSDLYLSARKNGEWGKPVSLGPQVNTSGKEGFPFLFRDRDGKTCLVFSSDRGGGMGGMDLYYTKLNGPGSGIMLFGSPVNSPSDDFAMSFSLEKGVGYFTSNRKGAGGDDIYKFTFDTPPVITKGP